jgi:hypothetical protein
MSDYPTIIKRNRGGQPGNRNAFRHGYYSKSFSEEELKRLDDHVKGEFTDEIAVARVNAGRLAELLKEYKTMPFENMIAASNALNNFLDRIQTLSRTYHFLYRKSTTTFEQAMELLESLPPEED